MICKRYRIRLIKLSSYTVDELKLHIEKDRYEQWVIANAVGVFVCKCISS